MIKANYFLKSVKGWQNNKTNPAFTNAVTKQQLI
jgi:hypothetical protein